MRQHQHPYRPGLLLTVCEIASTAAAAGGGGASSKPPVLPIHQTRPHPVKHGLLGVAGLTGDQPLEEQSSPVVLLVVVLTTVGVWFHPLSYSYSCLFLLLRSLQQPVVSWCGGNRCCCCYCCYYLPSKRNEDGDDGLECFHPH